MIEDNLVQERYRAQRSLAISVSREAITLAGVNPALSCDRKIEEQSPGLPSGGAGNAEQYQRYLAGTESLFSYT